MMKEIQYHYKIQCSCNDNYLDTSAQRQISRYTSSKCVAEHGTLKRGLYDQWHTYQLSWPHCRGIQSVEPPLTDPPKSGQPR